MSFNERVEAESSWSGEASRVTARGHLGGARGCLGLWEKNFLGAGKRLIGSAEKATHQDLESIWSGGQRVEKFVPLLTLSSC